MKRFLVLVALPLVLAMGPATGSAAEQDPVKLGAGLVEHLGCLFCHGLGGRKGIENPNAVRKYVPAWDEQAFIERYPKPNGLKDTIRKGRFPEKARGATGNPIPMPPWGNRLSDTEMDAIIAYIWSLRETPAETHAKGGRGALEPEITSSLEGYPTLDRGVAPAPRSHTGIPSTADPQVALGEELVKHLGCLYCHGLGGRKGIENPNAVRKYVPAWDEAAFAQRYPVDDGVRYVIEKGRFPAKDPDAKGNPVPMPPWGNRINAEELDAIVSYIWSLRETPVETHQKGGLGNQ
ncbi:MAG: c-type cytochrome [Leptospirillia bacterium]